MKADHFLFVVDLNERRSESTNLVHVWSIGTHICEQLANGMLNSELFQGMCIICAYLSLFLIIFFFGLSYN